MITSWSDSDRQMIAIYKVIVWDLPQENVHSWKPFYGEVWTMTSVRWSGKCPACHVESTCPVSSSSNPLKPCCFLLIPEVLEKPHPLVICGTLYFHESSFAKTINRSSTATWGVFVVKNIDEHYWNLVVGNQMRDSPTAMNGNLHAKKPILDPAQMLKASPIFHV